MIDRKASKAKLDEYNENMIVTWNNYYQTVISLNAAPITDRANTMAIISFWIL